MKNCRYLKKSLMFLVENNNTEEINNYLDTYPPGANDDVKSSAFLFSCRSGKLEIAKLLLEYVSPNCRYSDGQTAIMLISQLGVEIRGILDFIDLLIVKGCEVDLVDFCGKSALHWATIKNSVCAVRTLIGYRCNINCVDLHGFTPLIYAAKLNFSSIVSILLHSGADPTKSSKQQGTAIHQAVRCRSGDALRQLIPFYRHLNIIDSRNQSPIDLAVLFNDYEMVSILLNSKKDIEVNRRPSFAPFRTPLEEACLKNNIQIAKALIVAGADVNYPLEFAFEFERQNSRSLPVSPVMFAVKHQNKELLELLLSHGADVNIHSPKSPGYATLTTPMSVAIEVGNRDLIATIDSVLKMVSASDIGECFVAACVSKDVSVVLEVTKRHNIDYGKHLLKNGAPVILELFRNSDDTMVNKELLFDFFSKTKGKILEILNSKIAESLSKRNFGSSMQFYRCAWLKLAEQFPCHLATIPLDEEYCYVKFIISFLESLFMKRKADDYHLMSSNLELLDVFSQRLIRWAMHSTNVIKSILLAKSFYSLAVLVNIHFDENIVFWDQNYKQPVDLCEFALFFDNLDAALILNLTCGLSLRCLNEYDTLPYIPEIINRSIEYNDVDKISALKYLSRNVKSLKTLCKYAIKKYVPNSLMFDRLPCLSATVMSDLNMDLSGYICDFDSGLIPLCVWAAIDLSHLNLVDM